MSVQEVATGVDLFRLEKRVANRLALGSEEGEAHRAADHQPVDDPEQGVDNAELVGDLRAAEHGDKRVLRPFTETEQHLHLTLQKKTHRRREVSWRTDDRRVGPMRGPERVVDVRVDAIDQLGDVGRIVRGLPRVEPDVLDQLDAGSQLREAFANRLERERRVRSTLRSAEMARAHHRRPSRGQPLDRRQRRADPEVIGDDRPVTRAVEGHVEVAPDEHTATADIAKVVETGDPVGGHRQATCLTRSTSRFE